MEEAKFYGYSVQWYEPDQAFVGLCAEMPSLSHIADSQEGALAGIRDLVADVLRDLGASGEPIPEPLSRRAYSGKIALRVPPHQHRALAYEAAREGVSLNRWLSMKLASPPPSPLGDETVLVTKKRAVRKRAGKKAAKKQVSRRARRRA